MKTTKKLEIKKVTLQDLDKPKLDAMAGGGTVLCTRADLSCGVKFTCLCNTGRSCESV